MTRLPGINVHDGVENERAYISAAQDRIRANAAKTRRAQWLAMDGGQRAHDFLYGVGQFEDRVIPGYGNGEEGEYNRVILHPVRRAGGGDFVDAMRKSADKWGGLTEGQHAAVLKTIDRAEARAAEWDAKNKARAAADASSVHVGEVGKRQDFALTLERCISFETAFGMLYIHLFRDAANNVVVYKGSKDLGLNAGETVALKATVKEHGERNGVKQTILSRPKVA